MNWSETKNIFISWVASPVLTGVVAFIIFAIIRFLILLSSNPFSRGYYTFSVILFVTIAIDVFFIFNKGTQNFTYFHENVYDDKWVVPTSLGIGVVVGLFWLWPIGPYVKRQLQAKREVRQAEAATQAIVNANMLSMHSIGGKKEAKGEQYAEYNPEEGSIKLTLSESVKSLKISIEEKEFSDSDSTQKLNNKSFKTKMHALGDQLGTSIKEVFDTSFTAQIQPQIQNKNQAELQKKKNFLVRFEEATYKQDLEEQAFQESRETQECWQGAATYDAEVEELYTYVQAFTAALR